MPYVFVLVALRGHDQHRRRYITKKARAHVLMAKYSCQKQKAKGLNTNTTLLSFVFCLLIKVKEQRAKSREVEMEMALSDIRRRWNEKHMQASREITRSHEQADG